MQRRSPDAQRSPVRPRPCLAPNAGPGSMRSLFAVAALAVVALTATSMPAWAQAPRKIVYGTNIDPNNTQDPRAGAQARILEAFRKAHPDIEVQLDVDPRGDAHLRALRARSKSVDVIKVAGHSLPEAVATGQLTPLDDLINADKVSTTDWLIPLSDSGIGGKIYGLPLDYRMPLLLFRKSALAKAGVQPPRTWAEVCEVGPKLAKVRPVGYAIPLGQGGGAQAFDELMFSSMVSAATQKYFAPDNRKLLVTKDQFVRAAKTVTDLFGKCGATPAASQQFGYNEIHDGLRADTVAMANFGMYRFAAIANGGAGDDLGWAAAPAYEPNGKQTVKGYLAVLNKASANQKDAWEFLKFMGSPEAQAIAAEGGEVVARASVYDAAPYFATPAGLRQKAWAAEIRQRGFWPSYPMSASAYNRELIETFQKIVLGQITPEQGYDTFVARYQAILDKE